MRFGVSIESRLNPKQMKMKKLKKDQRGITLVELVIAITIIGLVSAAITMALFQVFTMNTRTSNRMAAVSQVQHAGKLVSEDILEVMPENVDTVSEFLKLTWTDHVVIYTLEDNKLWRSESVNGGEPTVTLVAEYIDPDHTSCIPAVEGLPVGEVLTFKVTANVGGQSETREYEVKPRPGS